MTEIISLKYGVNISKEHVRKALVDIDPEGVSMRKKKTIKRRTYETNGPFDVFHIDGNDKLKRFGFAIHGCIDGFSRKLIWLFVSTTNNDPLVVANFYLKAITNLGRAPNTLRMDLGTENVYCEELQVFFTKSSNSFLYAASTRNQRIEAFWSRLKKLNLSWWIDFFSNLIKCRIFNPGSHLHREALIFRFMPVIQAQLNDFVRIWNIRKIRKLSTCPGSVPEILFNAPSTVAFDEKGYSVDDLDLRVAQDIIGIVISHILFVRTTRCMSYSYAALISTNLKFHVTQRMLLFFMLKFWNV